MSEDTTLVLGGTGKTGRRVAERLTALGVPVRIGSRSGEPPFDWAKPETWAPALRAVRSVYISYYPDLAVPGAVDVVGSFANLAVKEGVPRLVLLAGRGEAEAERAEQAVRDSGADLTIVRATWFMQNFSEDYMIEHILAGAIALPAGDTSEPFVDADDIAEPPGPGRSTRQWPQRRGRTRGSPAGRVPRPVVRRRSRARCARRALR